MLCDEGVQLYIVIPRIDLCSLMIIDKRRQHVHQIYIPSIISQKFLAIFIANEYTVTVCYL